MPKEQLKTLTEQMYYVLLALKKERCGIEISAYVDTLTHGRLHLGPGTLYAILSKFEQEQMILPTRTEGRKQWYQISKKGAAMLLEEYERIKEMLEITEWIIHEEG